jgi:hypothetical protein
MTPCQYGRGSLDHLLHQRITPGPRNGQATYLRQLNRSAQDKSKALG